MKRFLTSCQRVSLTFLLLFFSLNSLAQEQLNVTVYNQTNTPTLTTNFFQRIEVDGKGHIWVGTNGQGIVKFNPANDTAVSAFTTHQVRAITKDSNGDIWVGSAAGGIQASTGGIRKFLQGNINAVTTWLPSSGIVSRYVNGLVEGPGNTIWAAHGQTLDANSTTVEGGISWYDGSSWTKIPKSSFYSEGLPLSDRRVLTVGKAKDGVWAGVDISCKNGVCDPPYIAAYSSAGTYIGNYSDGLPFSNETSSPRPRAIFSDSRGRVWLGLSSGSSVIAVYDGSWKLLDSTVTKLPIGTAINFHSIKEDRSGNILIGTSNGLLKFYGGDTNSNDYTLASNWNLFTLKNGLPSNSINGVAIDSLQNIWLATPAGIVKFRFPNELLIVNPNPSLLSENGVIITDISTIVSYSRKATVLRGAATDGVTRLLLVKETDDNSKINFKITDLKDGSLGTMSSPSLALQSIDITPIQATVDGRSGWYAIAVYSAPDSYGQSYDLDGGREARLVVSKVNSTDIIDYKLKLYSPPVVLVHGMWSSPDVWISGGGFRDFLKQNGVVSVMLANYSGNNHETFDPLSPKSLPGRAAVKKAIEDAIADYKKLRIATTQVDVVGHSLGGLMTRSYIQQPDYINNKLNYGKGYVHKLITIGTPHEGSPLGPLLWDNKDVEVTTYYNPITQATQTAPIGSIFAAAGMLIGTCHNDFRSSSTAYSNLFSTNKVKAHAIVTSYKAAPNSVDDAGANWSYNVLNVMLQTFFLKNHDEVFQRNDGSVKDSDLIVAVESQDGGLTQGAGVSPIIYSTTHSKIPLGFGEWNQPASTEVQQRVLYLLRSDDSKLFEDYFQKHVDINSQRVSQSLVTSVGKFSNEVTSQQTVEPKWIKISSPSSGTKVLHSPNTSITLSFDLVGNVLPIKGVFMVEDIGSFPIPKTAPYSVTFNLPKNAPLGRVGISAVVRDTTGVLLADTSSFIISPIGTVTNLHVSPDTITLNEYIVSQPLFVTGEIINGGESMTVDLTDGSTGTYYLTGKDNAVVNVSTNGLITAVGVGEDIVEVNNAGNIVQVYVKVTAIKERQSQTITFPPITDKIYGDPAFTLSATATSGLPVSFSVVSGPATLSGSTLTITGAGTITVRASQTGNETFETAPNLDRTFTVAKSSQTINFPTVSDKTVGDTSFQVQPTATSNLEVSVSVVSGPATVANNTVTLTGEGTVTLKASQAGNENYSAANNVERSFCVIPAKPTISKLINVLSSSSQVGNQWYLNSNIIEGATSVTYTATESGSYTVQVTGSCGKSAMSLPMEYTKEPNDKQNQTITFPALADKTYGDQSFTLIATASSELPVIFSIVSGPATLSGSSLTLTGAGTVTVRASQAGNETYEAAPDVDRTFNVAKASQIITFAEIQDKAVGDASFQINASSTSSLTVSISVVSGPATVANNVVSITGEGTVTLKASQSGNENYLAAIDVNRSFCVIPAKPTISNKEDLLTSSSQVGNQWYFNGNVIHGATSSTYIATESGSYTVQVTGSCGNSLKSEPMLYEKDPDTKQDQTIDFPSIMNKTYGDPSFALSATSTSGLPVTFSIVSGPATLSGSSLTLTGAGTVTVRASQAGNETYEAAPDVDRTFNVAKASQIIIFAEIQDKAVGDAPFQVNASASSGLIVSLSIVSGPATITGNTVTLTGQEGTVTISARQLGSDNYLSAADVTKDFCVKPAKATITQSDNMLISSSAVGNQWYYNGLLLEGATSNTYLANKTGSYSVQLVGICGNSMSDPVNITIDTDPNTDDKIIAFPVPAKDVLNIIFPGKEKWTEVKLIDKEGKTWITAKPKSNGNQMMLKIDSLPRGVYIILINTKEATYRKTITIE